MYFLLNLIDLSNSIFTLEGHLLFVYTQLFFPNKDIVVQCCLLTQEACCIMFTISNF